MTKQTKTSKNTEKTMLQHRNVRQSDIINQSEIELSKVGIIGAGAIGRQLAMMLAVMGVGHIEIMDGDEVDTENLGCQGHLEKHVGVNKAFAVADAIKDVNSCVKVVPHKGYFTGHEMEFDGMCAIFSAVDRMEVRSLLYECWTTSSSPLYVDGRMNAMTCRSIMARKSDRETIRYYRRTLFEARDGIVAPCTAKATFFNASIAAGLMVGMFVNSKFLKMAYVEKDVLFNIPAFMLSVDVDNEMGNDPQIPHQEHLLRGTQFDAVLETQPTRITPSESLPSAGSAAELRCPTTP